MARKNEVALTSLKELEVGDIVRHKSGGAGYVVTTNFVDRVTAVRSVDVTNPGEWLKITNDNEAVPVTRLYPDDNENNGAEKVSEAFAPGRAVPAGSGGDGGDDSGKHRGYATLRQLFLDGPTSDDGIASQTDRLIAVERGWVERRGGYSFLTNSGVRVALDFGLDREKERSDRERREAADKIADLEKKLAGWGNSFANFLSGAEDIRKRNEAAELKNAVSTFLADVKKLGGRDIPDLEAATKWFATQVACIREQNGLNFKLTMKVRDLEAQIRELTTQKVSSASVAIENFLWDASEALRTFTPFTRLESVLGYIQNQVELVRNQEVQIKDKADTILGANATIDVLERNLKEERASKAQVRDETESLRAHLKTEQASTLARQEEIWRLESLVAEKDHVISKLREEITGHVADVALLRNRNAEAAARVEHISSSQELAVRRIVDIQDRVEAVVYDPLGKTVIRLKAGFDGLEEPYDLAVTKGFADRIGALRSLSVHGIAVL
ncbi:hypothetical protein [Methylosinus sp. PW1]|uniref:hypothetical protein n=1 Tax=Methylosinus sp. PW1 TaxID=107636 RepID=UPI0012EB06ED|nr:hypothetical protein [Methylosinus sp. PW1]